MTLDDKPALAGTRRDPHAGEVSAWCEGGKSKSGRGKSITSRVCKTGHMHQDCNKNKDKSKGKGKSVKTSEDGIVECYSCGGNHYAGYSTSNKCHKSGRKGRGKSSAKRKNKNKSMQSREAAKKMSSSGKLQISGGMSPSGNTIQKFGRVRQTVCSLRCLERSTSILYFITRENNLITCNRGSTNGSSSITTQEQLRHPHLGSLPKAFCCTKSVSSSLRMVRTFRTSAEQCCRQQTQVGRICHRSAQTRSGCTS